MYEEKRIGAILLMAGVGHRFGSEFPKQFHLLGGKPVYTYALETCLKTGFFDEIILVCHPDWIETMTHGVVAGGSTRQQSSYLGLRAFKKRPDIVLIHDAVRPFVTAEILEENIRLAIAHGAVDTCIPSTDTLVYAPGGEKIAKIPNRADYLRGQTPQTFRMDWILEAHEKALADGIENATDDCQLVLRMGHPVHVAKGDEKNLKITSEIDLLIAEKTLSCYNSPTMESQVSQILSHFHHGHPAI